MKEGGEGHIIAKMNSLLDQPVIQKLYEASMAGVEIELIVRGICTLRPGLEGISDNITVRSIVGRQLEHSRIFWFANNGDEQLFMSSADWMPRNLNAEQRQLPEGRGRKGKRNQLPEPAVRTGPAGSGGKYGKNSHGATAPSGAAAGRRRIDSIVFHETAL